MVPNNVRRCGSPGQETRSLPAEEVTESMTVTEAELGRRLRLARGAWKLTQAAGVGESGDLFGTLDYPQPPTNIPTTPAMSPTSPSGRASAAGVAPPPGARLARFTHKVA